MSALRDAPIEPHVCRDWVSVDGYCMKCAEKVGASRPLRGPIVKVKGLRKETTATI